MKTQTNIKEVKFTVKRGLLDCKLRQLIINSDFIKFEDKNLLSNAFTQFDKHLIKDYRFGVKWIRGFEFTIGREYQIFIRNPDNKVLKINFKSFYGIKKNAHHKLYAEIISALWRFYFSDITSNFIEKFQKEEEFSIGKVHFTKDNLTINVSGILKEEKRTISWDRVKTRDYQTYFAIYSLDDPTNINRGYSYLDDWNTGLLYSVVRTILHYKNVKTDE